VLVSLLRANSDRCGPAAARQLEAGQRVRDRKQFEQAALSKDAVATGRFRCHSDHTTNLSVLHDSFEDSGGPGAQLDVAGCQVR
jgi:hypothetical protein